MIAKFFSTTVFLLVPMLVGTDAWADLIGRDARAISILLSNESAYQVAKPVVSGTDAAAISLLMSEQRDERFQLLPLSTHVEQLLKYLEEALQRKIHVKYYPWKRVLHNGVNGEGIVFGIYKTKERERIFIFSEPVYSDYIFLVTRCDDTFSFKTIADLKGKTIGMSPGASAGEEFDREVGASIKPEYNSSSVAGQFSKLYQKRLDAFFYFEVSNDIERIQREINQLYATQLDEYKENKRDIFCVLPKPLANLENHFAIGKQQDRTVLNEIDKVLLKARRNGDLDRIFRAIH